MSHTLPVDPTAVLGAFQAGKLPSQKQSNAFIDVLLASELMDAKYVGSPVAKVGSANSQKLLLDVRELLQAYRDFGTEKNDDDQLPEVIWNLRKAAFSDDLSFNPELVESNVKQVSQDAQALAQSLLTILKIATSHMSSESGSLFSDFMSFIRDVLADTAESIEQEAGKAKEALREMNEEKDRESHSQRDERQGDIRARFESTMDSIKEAGSKSIGAAQETQAAASEVASKTGDRLRRSTDKFIRRTQNDPEYRKAVSAIFKLGDKWVDRAAQTIDKNKDATLEDFIDGPTEHILPAMRSLRILIERVAGGQSIQSILNALRQCLSDIHDDPALRRFLRDLASHVQQILHDADYINSEKSIETRVDLSCRWDDLTDMRSENGRRWKNDVAVLDKEMDRFVMGLKKDKALNRLRDAHAKFGKDLASTIQEASQWIWQDFVDVVLPRILSCIQRIPVPRTEYKSDELDFVIEDLDLSCFSALPGHAHITNTTDMEIDKDSSTMPTRTDFGTKSHIHLTGVQVSAQNISFWYHDKTAKTISEVSGIIDIVLPPKGIDIDIKLCMLPTTSGAEDRKRHEAFHTLESVVVNLNDLEIKIIKSSHPIFTAIFKPIVLSRLAEAIRKTLEEQVTFAIKFIDHTAYDLHNRAIVFMDAGVPTSAAYISAAWSELGRFTKETGGFWSGLRMTNVGFISDDPTTDYTLAAGLSPQILANVRRDPPPVDPSVVTAVAVEMAKEEVTSFWQGVENRAEEEKHSRGWRSAAFDLI